MRPALALLGALLLGHEHPVTQPVYGIPATNQQAPIVASDGTDSIVLWADADAGRLWVARISATGDVLTAAARRTSRCTAARSASSRDRSSTRHGGAASSG